MKQPTESILYKLFFHPKNVYLLQKLIIMRVYQVSNGEYLIERQKKEDLLVVMMYIYEKYAEHLPYDFKSQINRLNNLVADEVLPGIITEIKSYFGYMERAFGPARIMPNPINLSKAGSKLLPSVI
jgi:hypothetical protein